jgi:hypothetical protein
MFYLGKQVTSGDILTEQIKKTENNPKNTTITTQKDTTKLISKQQKSKLQNTHQNQQNIAQKQGINKDIYQTKLKKISNQEVSEYLEIYHELSTEELSEALSQEGQAMEGEDVMFLLGQENHKIEEELNNLSEKEFQELQKILQSNENEK